MYRPDHLDPAELDAFLAHGWYRMRQAIFTCRYVILRGWLYSVVWTRLPLDGYVFRRSLRKKMRRVESRFRVDVAPLDVDDEKEALYARYRDHFKGEISDTLTDTLYEPDEDEDAPAAAPPRDLFDSHQVTIRDGERLIAYSVFDLGRDSIQSVIGVYDPDYARYSLGFYTMLREVRFGLDAGLRYHYPGYVVPGYPAFDYKLQAGAMEQLDAADERWRPYETLDLERLPSRMLRARLEAVASALARLGVDAELRLYPLYRSAELDARLSGCLKEPIFILCFPERPGPDRLIIVHDLGREVFRLEHCQEVADLSDRIEPRGELVGPTPSCLHLLRRVTLLAEAQSPDALAWLLPLLSSSSSR